MTERARRLAHDLNHMLTAILAAVDSTLAREGLDAETRTDMLIARQATGRAAALLADGAPRPTVLSLPDTLRDIAPLLVRRIGPGIRLELELAEPGARVRADPTQLARVLLNLAANAGDAMPAGGTLVLRSGQTASHATIAMQDGGAGIPPDALERIFEPGFTTRANAGGRGLGLAIVSDIVRHAGGHVTAESAMGRGTTVMVHWPRIDIAGQTPPPTALSEADPPALIGKPVPAVAPQQPAGTVLLVEDEPMLRQLAEHALQQAGWRVAAADTGAAALALATTVTPDIVVSDVALPGMDGPGLVTALRARWPNLPALLVSGYAESAVRDDPGADGMAFLAKPYTLAALIAAVRAAVLD